MEKETDNTITYVARHTLAYSIVKDVRNMCVLSSTQLEYLSKEYTREQLLSLVLLYNTVMENVNCYMDTH